MLIIKKGANIYKIIVFNIVTKTTIWIELICLHVFAWKTAHARLKCASFRAPPVPPL